MTMPQGGEGLLNTQQTMERMGLSQSQLARLRESRRIGFFKRAGRIFYASEEVERVLKTFEVPAVQVDIATQAHASTTSAIIGTAREVAA